MDKNGIWIALKLLKEIPVIKVLFTVSEEVGGIGASAVDMSFFKNVGYVLEGDRRGNSDLITDIYSKTCSFDFLCDIKPIMRKYGYKETSGMFTDIDVFLDREIGVSCINYSVGYYNPHSVSEFTVLEDMFCAAQFAKEIIYSLKNNRYEHSIEKNEYKNSYYSYFNEYRTDDDFHCNKQNHNGLVSIDDYRYNRRVKKYSGEICDCGEELEEREHTYYCPFCNKHYISCY